MISVDISRAKRFVSKRRFKSMYNKVIDAFNTLQSRSGAGSEMTGWLTLPIDVKSKDISRINKIANKIRKEADLFLVVGIGGSYLGARAVIEALTDPFGGKGPNIVFCGNNISGHYLSSVLNLIKKSKNVYVNVISKSGTTLETSIAFRVIAKALMGKYKSKKDFASRVIATTDPKKGILNKLVSKYGWEKFEIPPDVGGRFSVLTPVGLLPIAVAGISISNLIKGARDMYEMTNEPSLSNPSLAYALIRNLLYKKGKKIEILVNYENTLHFIGEWWKQLYGESEGKEGKGIFPAISDFTTDLHSIGQLIQEGERNIFETVLYVDKMPSDVVIPRDKDNIDELNYLAGKKLSWVNERAFIGTRDAHIDGGVPVITIKMEKLSAYHIGGLLYFFERACGISGYTLGVNPFDQPGVQKYKDNVKALIKDNN